MTLAPDGPGDLRRFWVSDGPLLSLEGVTSAALSMLRGRASGALASVGGGDLWSLGEGDPGTGRSVGGWTSGARWSLSGGRTLDLILSLRHRASGAPWSLWERILDALELVEIDVCRSTGWPEGSGWRSHFREPVFACRRWLARVVCESRRIPIPRLRARARQLPRSFIYRHSAWWYIVGRCSSTHSKYEVPCTSKRDVVG